MGHPLVCVSDLHKNLTLTYFRGRGLLWIRQGSATHSFFERNAFVMEKFLCAIQKILKCNICEIRSRRTHVDKILAKNLPRFLSLLDLFFITALMLIAGEVIRSHCADVK